MTIATRSSKKVNERNGRFANVKTGQSPWAWPVCTAVCAPPKTDAHGHRKLNIVKSRYYQKTDPRSSGASLRGCCLVPSPVCMDVATTQAGAVDDLIARRSERQITRLSLAIIARWEDSQSARHGFTDKGNKLL